MTPLAAPADFSVEPPPLPRPKFTLSPTSLAVLAICAAIHLIYASLRLVMHAPLLAVQDVGVFALGFLLSMGLATLAWRLDSRRRAGNAVFICLILLFTAGRMLEAITLAAGIPRRTTTAQAGGPRFDSREMKQATDRVMHVFQARMEAYNRASADLRAAGLAEAAGLDSREAIAHRRALVKTYADTNLAFAVTCQTLEPTLRTELLRIAPEEQARRTTNEIMEGFDMPLVFRIRDCERRLALALDSLLAVYDAEFPRWHLSAEKRMVFDDPSAISRQRFCVQQIMAIANEERGLQQQKDARKAARLARQNAVNPAAALH